MKLFLFFVLAFTTSALAQPADYWQQHVSYQIEATLLDSIHSLEGKLKVTYTNNSPDTLREIYFHLYNNAFRPGSMMHKRAQELNDHGLLERFNRYKSPADWGGYTINKVNVNGNDSRFNITGTVMKVSLPTPLAPHSQTTIDFNFFEQIPRQTRRNGWMNSDSITYSMAQCYPKVCAYDREGWHNQEYIGREFYGVWGEFDVKLTVPAFYCLAATGEVQNPDEVKWGYERIAKGEKKGVVYPKDYPRSGNLMWHFKASNVHDFAWAAHNYIHEWDTWSDTVTVHCLYKTNEAKEWKQAMKHTFAMLEHHSKAIGWYQYRNFYNTHSGDGGMEYPQLIMDMSPNAGLIMHEGAHQWFYGMLGNNETRYAFLDEGFTEFLEMTGMEWYNGRHNERSPHRDSSWLTKMFIPEYDTRRNYYSSYLNLATDGYEEPLNLPHDWAREGVNAGQVYFKTLNGLAQLEYVLGDSVFWGGMKEYFRRWHFKSPNLNDFKRTMEDVSGMKLDWYFDQWFHTTRTIDYSACGVSSDEQPDGSYKTTVELFNNGLGVMPIDLTLHYDDGSTSEATIPLALNQGAGYKKTEAGRLFFEPWDWVSKSYEGSMTTPKEVTSFSIDDTYRLMDINRKGNTTGLIPQTEWSFLKQYHTVPNLAGSYAVVRPIVWWEETSGLNLGAGILFGNSRHSSADAKIILKTDPDRTQRYGGEIFEADPLWYDYIDGKLSYSANTKWLGDLTSFDLKIGKMYGLGMTSVSIAHAIRPTYLYLGPTHRVKASFTATDRFVERNMVYPVYGGTWDDGGSMIVTGEYDYSSASGKTNGRARYRIGSHFLKHQYDGFWGVFDDYSMTSFNGLDFMFSHKVDLSSQMSVLLRGNVAMNWGDLPSENSYYLNQANPYDAYMASDFWNAVTSISNHFSTQSHFRYGGGAGVRGYLPEYAYNGFGMTGEMSLPNPLRSLGSFPASFAPYVFVDAGWIGNGYDISEMAKDMRVSTGIGFKVNILSWLPWQLHGVANEYAGIPVIGVTFPVYLNHPNDDKEHFAFRYTISLGTTF